MKPGPELDALVAEKVMGWESGFVGGKAKAKVPGSCGTYECTRHFVDCPPFSSDMTAAWRVVDKLAPVIGDFHEADGFFILQYADSADHGKPERGCDPGPIESEGPEGDEEDVSRWSCHFHPGHPGADTDSARLFPEYKKVCARGRTAAHAICLAALKVYATSPKPGDGERGMG